MEQSGSSSGSYPGGHRFESGSRFHQEDGLDGRFFRRRRLPAKTPPAECHIKGMTVSIVNGDGTVSEVWAGWHPPVASDVAPLQKIERPAAAWTTVGRLEKRRRGVDEARSAHGVGRRTGPDCDARRMVDGIRASEIPLEVYLDTEDGEPWRHFGTLVREIPRGDLGPAKL